MIYSDLFDPYVCKCDEKNGWFTAGDICIKKTIVDTGNFFCTTCAYSPYTAKQVSYDSVESKNIDINSLAGGLLSGTFDFLYLKAAVGCKEENDP